MPIRFTLRFRIISVITLFTIFLIASFTALLLTRQLAVTTENTQYRARVGTFAAKGAFERILISHRSTDPAQDFLGIIPILKEGQLTDDILIADRKGKIVAAGRTDLVGNSLSGEDLTWTEYAEKVYSPKNWFYAQVNPDLLSVYLPLTIDQTPTYVAVLRYSLGNLKTSFQQIGTLCLTATLGVILATIPLCLLLIRAILGPIRVLNEATKDVTGGNLTREISVSTEDELGELAQTFNEMTVSLLKLKERAENANPLTRLPGNNVTQEEITSRIKKGIKFVAIYLDLDNFKAFNDKYGIAAGDAVIRLTAQLLREALKSGSPMDFLGHEGGDDFMVITPPEKFESICEFICIEFDRRIKELYAPEDQQRGSIVSTDREGNIKQFPFITVSLAGVTNAHRVLTSYAEVTNICAEVKKKAKRLSRETGKSSYFLDRRRGDRTGDGPPG